MKSPAASRPVVATGCPTSSVRKRGWTASHRTRYGVTNTGGSMQAGQDRQGMHRAGLVADRAPLGNLRYLMRTARLTGATIHAGAHRPGDPARRTRLASRDIAPSTRSILNHSYVESAPSAPEPPPLLRRRFILRSNILGPARLLYRCRNAQYRR